jgi:hypothetical protein
MALLVVTYSRRIITDANDEAHRAPRAVPLLD